MSRTTPTTDVYIGESLPALSIFWRENGQLVTGLASGHTFELKIASLDDGTVLVTKTTGIVGQAGSGFQPLGTPNVVVQWAAGDLADLTPGTYRAQLKITRTADSRVRIDQFLLRALAVL